jgi:transposase
VSRQVNAPPSARPRRSVSPEEGPRSAIPLFNTSVKGRARLARPADCDPMSLDSSLVPSPAQSDKEMEAEQVDGDAASKKKSLKEKIKAAKESIKADEQKNKGKLAGKPKAKGADKFSLGVDYVKLHESRPGGFKKKLR